MITEMYIVGWSTRLDKNIPVLVDNNCLNYCGVPKFDTYSECLSHIAKLNKSFDRIVDQSQIRDKRIRKIDIILYGK